MTSLGTISESHLPTDNGNSDIIMVGGLNGTTTGTPINGSGTNSSSPMLAADPMAITGGTSGERIPVSSMELGQEVRAFKRPFTEPSLSNMFQKETFLSQTFSNPELQVLEDNASMSSHSPVSSPGPLSPSYTPQTVSSPENLQGLDQDSQQSLIQRSEHLHLNSDSIHGEHTLNFPGEHYLSGDHVSMTILTRDPPASTTDSIISNNQGLTTDTILRQPELQFSSGDRIGFIQTVDFSDDANIESPKKLRKGSGDGSDIYSSASGSATPAQTSAFDAGAALSPEYIFQKFGKEDTATDSDEIFSFGTSHVKTDVPVGVVTYSPECFTDAVGSTIVSPNFEMPPPPNPPATRVSKPMSKARKSLVQSERKHKEPSLSVNFPSKSQGIELKITSQPEEQHRARYMTEGSRGALKDRAQGHPSVQLTGYSKPCNMQIFVASDVGKIKPHGFYQACKVFGKTTTPCSEREFDNTTVIEVELNPDTENVAKLSVDCFGILKLRNADVENRSGAGRSKKKSTKARIVFRVNLVKPDGSYLTLQACSDPILCTQPAGQPEISKKSLEHAYAVGGQELFIIGKNFTRNSKVIFQEVEPKEKDAGDESDESRGKVLWSHNADVDWDYFQQTHLICTVPAYRDQSLRESKVVEIIVSAGGKKSEPQCFTYIPNANNTIDDPVESIKCEVPTPMETDRPNVVNILSSVSPEALELQRMIEEQHQQQKDQGEVGTQIFQIPVSVALPSLSASPIAPLTSPKASPMKIVQSTTPFTPIVSSESPTSVVFSTSPAPVVFPSSAAVEFSAAGSASVVFDLGGPEDTDDDVQIITPPLKTESMDHSGLVSQDTSETMKLNTNKKPMFGQLSQDGEGGISSLDQPTEPVFSQVEQSQPADTIVGVLGQVGQPITSQQGIAAILSQAGQPIKSQQGIATILSQAGQPISSQQGIAAILSQAGQPITSQQEMTAILSQAGQPITSQQGIAAILSQAGQPITSQQEMTAILSQAGQPITSQQGIAAILSQAGQPITSQQEMTAILSQAGQPITSQHGIAAILSQAGQPLTSQGEITAILSQAGQQITSQGMTAILNQPGQAMLSQSSQSGAIQSSIQGIPIQAVQPLYSQKNTLPVQTMDIGSVDSSGNSLGENQPSIMLAMKDNKIQVIQQQQQPSLDLPAQGSDIKQDNVHIMQTDVVQTQTHHVVQTKIEQTVKPTCQAQSIKQAVRPAENPAKALTPAQALRALQLLQQAGLLEASGLSSDQQKLVSQLPRLLSIVKNEKEEVIQAQCCPPVDQSIQQSMNVQINEPLQALQQQTIQQQTVQTQQQTVQQQAVQQQTVQQQVGQQQTVPQQVGQQQTVQQQAVQQQTLQQLLLQQRQTVQQQSLQQQTLQLQQTLQQQQLQHLVNQNQLKDVATQQNQLSLKRDVSGEQKAQSITRASLGGTTTLQQSTLDSLALINQSAPGTSPKGFALGTPVLQPVTPQHSTPFPQQVLQNPTPSLDPKQGLQLLQLLQQGGSFVTSTPVVQIHKHPTPVSQVTTTPQTILTQTRQATPTFVSEASSMQSSSSSQSELLTHLLQRLPVQHPSLPPQTQELTQQLLQHLQQIPAQGQQQELQQKQALPQQQLHQALHQQQQQYQVQQQAPQQIQQQATPVQQIPQLPELLELEQLLQQYPKSEAQPKPLPSQHQFSSQQVLPQQLIGVPASSRPSQTFITTQQPMTESGSQKFHILAPSSSSSEALQSLSQSSTQMVQSPVENSQVPGSPLVAQSPLAQSSIPASPHSVQSPQMIPQSPQMVPQSPIIPQSPQIPQSPLLADSPQVPPSPQMVQSPDVIIQHDPLLSETNQASLLQQLQSEALKQQQEDQLQQQQPQVSTVELQARLQQQIDQLLQLQKDQQLLQQQEEQQFQQQQMEQQLQQQKEQQFQQQQTIEQQLLELEQQQELNKQHNEQQQTSGSLQKMEDSPMLAAALDQGGLNPTVAPSYKMDDSETKMLTSSQDENVAIPTTVTTPDDVTMVSQPPTNNRATQNWQHANNLPQVSPDDVDRLLQSMPDVNSPNS